MNRKTVCMVVAVLLILCGCSRSPQETIPIETTTAAVPGETLEATLPTEITEPVTEPMENEPAETVPETVPATEPEETDPVKPTDPKPTDPKPTEPPKETQPKPTDPPKETQPKPTEPKPTNPPKETEPKPTDPPKPTEPPATEPKDEHPPCDSIWGHAYIETIIRPTCTEQGYTKYFCSSCWYEYKANFVPALGGSHSYEESEVVKPTGISKGYTIYKCSKCGHEYKDNFVDPLPAEKIDIAALEEYGRQYAASLGYTPSTVPGFNNNAGYFPPLSYKIMTMEDGREAARFAVDYQYTNDIGGNREIDGRAVNVRFIPTGEPDCYLVYCFYGGLGV